MSPLALSAATEIAAPADLIFRVLASPERLPEWNGSVQRASRVGNEPIGLGSHAVMAGNVLGQSLESETVIVAWNPPWRFATDAVRGPRLQTNFQIETGPVACRVRVSVSGEVPGGRLGSMVAERLLRAELQRSLRQLRALCEREAADGRA